ncbi:MAG: beta-galactosidase, partial [Clostridiales bacterium]|nr:beta-galactosidase [Candidatus Coliplasma equi]
ISEYGGIGWNVGDGWGYGKGPKTEEEFYSRLEALTSALTDNPNVSGFCYTQLTDVEQERNGLFTFSRAPKFDLPRLKKIFSKERKTQ